MHYLEGEAINIEKIRMYERPDAIFPLPKRKFGSC